jgi:archaellum component FlaC
MRIPPELLPVLQITLPLVAAIFGAAWIQNKRIDDIMRRLDRIEDELRSIGKTLKEHGERLARLEERIPPLVHR